MKKSIIAFILIICMVFVFAGCKDAKATPDQVKTEETVVETAQTSITLTFNAFTYNGVENHFTLEYDDGNNPMEMRYNNITFTAQRDEKAEDVMNNAGYSDLKILETHDEFLGWMEYKMVIAQDDTVTYEKISDTLYKTKEIMGKTMPEYSVAYIAKWKNLSDDYYQAYGY